jgi:ankyrin repeat protein
MTNPRPATSRPLPDRPNLRHLKDQARDLFDAGSASSIADAQFRIARLYGFASWPKLKAHVEASVEFGQLKQAIDMNDLVRVKDLMTRHQALHRAPLGYGNDGPLTWVAECRVPWEPPSAARLAIATWMLEHGSDVHQGGDGPLMRAALKGERIPMMEVLLAHGADVNAFWHGHFPIIFAPCESLDPIALEWLLAHGANPNCGGHGYAISGHAYPGTALDYVIASYGRDPERLRACIDTLLSYGATTKYDAAPVLAVLRGQANRLAALLDADPQLARVSFPYLDCGQTGGRSLTLRGATLLHLAAEYGNTAAVGLLLDGGADVDGRAEVDDQGVGGQTALFHAVAQFDDAGLEVARVLLDRGADVTVRVTLPGAYERPEEVVTCTALGYALRFGGSPGRSTVTLLRERGARE